MEKDIKYHKKQIHFHLSEIRKLIHPAGSIQVIERTPEEQSIFDEVCEKYGKTEEEILFGGREKEIMKIKREIAQRLHTKWRTLIRIWMLMYYIWHNSVINLLKKC